MEAIQFTQRRMQHKLTSRNPNALPISDSPIKQIDDTDTFVDSLELFEWIDKENNNPSIFMPADSTDHNRTLRRSAFKDVSNISEHPKINQKKLVSCHYP